MKRGKLLNARLGSVEDVRRRRRRLNRRGVAGETTFSIGRKLNPLENGKSLEMSFEKKIFGLHLPVLLSRFRTPE